MGRNARELISGEPAAFLSNVITSPMVVGATTGNDGELQVGAAGSDNVQAGLDTGAATGPGLVWAHHSGVLQGGTKHI